MHNNCKISINRNMSINEEQVNVLSPLINKIDPTEFDVTVSALLIGLGAEKYIDIFRKQNIGQCALIELSNEDLVKLGIDDSNIRRKILDEVKSLPIYEEFHRPVSEEQANLDPLEIVDVLEESSQHLYRIYLSTLANTLAVKKTKHIPNCLLHKDKYASDIALSTLSELTNILNSMEIKLLTQMKALTQVSSKNKNKKILVGTVGTAAIAVLAMLFVRSLKQLK